MILMAASLLAATASSVMPAPDSFVAAWAPRERMSVSVWADRHRIIEGGAEPGPWRTERTPYLAEPMDDFADPRVGTIVLMKSARVGGTEMGNNMLGYAIDQQPGDVIYVYPRQADAEEECRTRLVPMIECSPRLRRHAGQDGEWSTKTEINLDTCNVFMAWANSYQTLIRRTCRYNFHDEADNTDEPTVAAIGDAVTLGTERVTTYRDRAKTVVTSTPTTPSKPGYRLFMRSDQREYHVPCPKCGTYQPLVFDQLKVDQGERDPDRILEHDLAYYECIHCGARIKDGGKSWMTLRGVWVPQCQTVAEKLPLRRKAIVARAVFNHPDRWTPRLDGDPPINRIRGYHIWSAYSPWRTFSQIMARWFAVQGRPMELRVFFNSWLGEPWEDVAQSTTPELLREVGPGLYPARVVPPPVQIIVAGVDVQAGEAEQGHIKYVIRGWGPDLESWLIDHGTVWANRSVGEDEMDALTRFHDDRLLAQFTCAAGGHTMAPVICVVDSGYRTEDVYDWCASHPGCLPGKGYDKHMAWGRYARAMAAVTVTPGVKMHHRPLRVDIDTYAAKEALYRWSKPDGAGARKMHLNALAVEDAAYLKEFSAEHLVTEKGGRQKWVKKTDNRKNDFLDAEVNALAAAELAGALVLEASPAVATEDEAPTPEPTPHESPRLGRGPLGLS